MAQNRCLDINPNIKVEAKQIFYLPDTADQFDFSEYDYVVDAIDTVTGKIRLIQEAKNNNVPVISSMGAGNKLNPAMFEVADIKDTSICPLAKVMRKELKKRGIEGVKVVYSKEQPIKPEKLQEEMESKGSATNERKIAPGSVAFVPSVVGLIIASEVIKDLVHK